MSSPGMPDPMGKRVAYLIKRVQLALHARLDRVLRPLGLTPPQYAVLSAIELEPGISNAALARAAFVTPQTMQGIVANLERAGFLARQVDPTNARILKGDLTAKGRKILARAHARGIAVESEMLGSLTPGDAKKLADWLAACAERLGTAAKKGPIRKAS